MALPIAPQPQVHVQIDWRLPVKTAVTQTIQEIAPKVEATLQAIVPTGVDLLATATEVSVGCVASKYLGPGAGQIAQSATTVSCLAAKPHIEEVGHKSVAQSVKYSSEKTEQCLHQSIDWL